MFDRLVVIAKEIASLFINLSGATDRHFSKINNEYNNNYVRVLNYHSTKEKYEANLDRQIKFLQKNFDIIDFNEFKKFLKTGKLNNDKPGVLITFDDGFKDNFTIARKVLNNNRCKGLFFICSDRTINDDSGVYMNANDIKKMLKEGHGVGCHTRTHHRFNINDTIETLNDEIVLSKSELQNALSIDADSFCYVGGEMNTYTKEAIELVEKHYDYAFMTYSEVTTNKTNNMRIGRTNVETSWTFNLFKFQVFGMMDKLYLRKKKKKY